MEEPADRVVKTLAEDTNEIELASAADGVCVALSMSVEVTSGKFPEGNAEIGLVTSSEDVMGPPDSSGALVIRFVVISESTSVGPIVLPEMTPSDVPDGEAKVVNSAPSEAMVETKKSENDDELSSVG